MEVSKLFEDRMQMLLGAEYNDFAKAMDESPAVSIKINRRKVSDPSVVGYEYLTPVAWAESGFYLTERPQFTLNPLMHAGVFYVQDASSMIYETVVKLIIEQGYVANKALRVADMCAAPGGKTTSMINALPEGSWVLANEFIGQRAEILKENLFKWGYPNVMISNLPTSEFRKLPDMFDIVAVDAPCSGEGMMRKEAVARTQWSEGLINQCAGLQREILANAYECLKPGGILIYSTCTFNREENEDNLQFLMDEYDMSPLNLNFPTEWGIMPGIQTEASCYRFMPHRTRGEGLFLAVLRKSGEYSPSITGRRDMPFDDLVDSKIRLKVKSFPTTIQKGHDVIPTAEGALRIDNPFKNLPQVELSEQDALSYLRNEALRFSKNEPIGFMVVTYKGFPLGTVKNIGSRANNLYPKNWKIRNL